MLYGEIITVCSQIHTKHVLCGQNVEYFNLKPGGTYSNYWALVVTLPPCNTALSKKLAVTWATKKVSLVYLTLKLVPAIAPVLGQLNTINSFPPF